MYTGSWDANVSSHQHPEPYHQTSSAGASASLQFHGRAVAAYGESNFGWWTYSIVRYFPDSSASASRDLTTDTSVQTLDGTTYLLNASSNWIAPNALLFFWDGLDENANHTLALTNTAGMNFALNSVTVFSSGNVPTDASSSANDPMSLSPTALTR